MADVRVRSRSVTKFLLRTCQLYDEFLFDYTHILTAVYAPVESPGGVDDYVSLVTGSIAEFYIRPILLCFGDFDTMVYHTYKLAIPAGDRPPTQLPPEFDSSVQVFEIVDSEYPGYVYLILTYLMTECVEDGRYSAERCQLALEPHPLVGKVDVDYQLHGPAVTTENEGEPPLLAIRLAGSRFSTDGVYCVRCLSWPTQAADWPTRHRYHGWPDSATVDRVIRDGCDVVCVPHLLCKEDEQTSRTQHRMSFSRAEIILLNSWIPVQQILYHMLRVFVKTERLTDITDDSGTKLLCNYHLKTLMLWVCELKPENWWTDDLNVVRICVDLMHVLAVWLAEARCKHYFITSCNLMDLYDNSSAAVTRRIASNLTSVTEAHLADWFIKNYVLKCAKICPAYVSQLFDDISRSSQLEKAVSAVADWRQSQSLIWTWCSLRSFQRILTRAISNSSGSMTLRSCLSGISKVASIDECIFIYFLALLFLHVACKVRETLSNEFLDILATVFLEANDPRRCLYARQSSVLSLSQAAKLMKVMNANDSLITVQLIEIELSKAYLYRALRCHDPERDSIYCLANVYLASLYYTTGQYHTARDHCSLVARSCDHSQCSSRVVQGELVPKIDDDVDNVLGLTVFYQYVRTNAFSSQQRQHVSVLTTELFARCLHIKCTLAIEGHHSAQSSSSLEILEYEKFCRVCPEIFVTDVLLFILLQRTKYYSNNRKRLVAEERAKLLADRHQPDTTKLVELLQKSAVEHLTVFHQLEADRVGSSSEIWVFTAFFEALYAFKRGRYRYCLQLIKNNICMLHFWKNVSDVLVYPEFCQLMDDDIVSLVGLTAILNPSFRHNQHQVSVSELSLTLYMMTQCQMKLCHSVTSLSDSLGYIDIVYELIDPRPLDELVLKLTERKIRGSMRRHLRR